MLESLSAAEIVYGTLYLSPLLWNANHEWTGYMDVKVYQWITACTCGPFHVFSSDSQKIYARNHRWIFCKIKSAPPCVKSSFSLTLPLVENCDKVGNYPSLEVNYDLFVHNLHNETGNRLRHGSGLAFMESIYPQVAYIHNLMIACAMITIPIKSIVSHVSMIKWYINQNFFLHSLSSASSSQATKPCLIAPAWALVKLPRFPSPPTVVWLGCDKDAHRQQE